jgi:hypothetical protein
MRNICKPNFVLISRTDYELRRMHDLDANEDGDMDFLT